MRKIMKYLIFFMVSFGSISCKVGERELIGVYFSECWLQGERELVLTLNSDGTFKYEKAYWQFDEEITGQWHTSSDTLILRSWFFTEEFLKKYSTENHITKDLIPEAKYSDSKGDEDRYLIRRNRLIRFQMNEDSRKCYLVSQNM